MLPRSRPEIANIKWHLSRQIEYSRQALRDYIAAVKSPVHARKYFPPVVRDAAIGLHVSMCRKFRQCLMLAEVGQAEGAEALCRSILEIFLAQAFVCRQSVRLKRVSGGRVNLHGKKLTQEFRAHLFLAHYLMQQEARMDRMEQIPTLKRAARAERKVAQPVLDKARNYIGIGWAQALRANTCGGLPVSDFAYSFGRGAYKYYRTIYSFQSEHVHPGEPRRFLRYRDESGIPTVSWHDDIEEVERALWCSVAAAGLAMNEFNRLLDKNHPRYVRLRLFDNAMPEMKQVFKGITAASGG